MTILCAVCKSENVKISTSASKKVGTSLALFVNNFIVMLGMSSLSLHQSLEQWQCAHNELECTVTMYTMSLSLQ